MRRSGLLALVAVVALAAGCGTATLLPDGRVLLLNIIAKQYDPATGRVVNLPAPPTVRAYATATLLQDGRVLIAGGASDIGSGASGSSETATLATAELYDPATGSYTPTGSMSAPRAFHTATLLADGRVLIQGGGTAAMGTGPGTPDLDRIPTPEIYDPASGTFTPTAGTTLMPMLWATSTLLQDGRVLIAGGATIPEPAPDATPGPDGDSPDALPIAHAELFDPATGTFTETGSLSAPRIWHTATRLPDGHVLVVGGSSSPSLTDTSVVDPISQSAEIFDPATGAFTTTAQPGAARMGHAAASLADGRVVIAGGFDTDEATPESLSRTAELFDPASGSFTPTGDMVAAQAFQTATTLPDGRVLLVGFDEATISGATGGATPDLLSTAQLYDPGAGTFSIVEVEPAILPSAPPQ